MGVRHEAVALQGTARGRLKPRLGPLAPAHPGLYDGVVPRPGDCVADFLTSLRVALGGRYDVEREIGRGGTAVVYLARDRKHDRPVALKVLRPELAASLIGAERFLREIRFAAQLNHPHILALIDSGETAGFVYYVAPWLDGGSLRTRLDADGRLTVPEAARVAVAIAAALAYAHSRGVIHRDIKPENILFQAGEPMVCDFGVALALDAASDRLTSVGVALGTPGYMSPEQTMGEETLDQRSDIYSLACVVHEMLTGRPLYPASTPLASLAKRLTEPVPSIRTSRRDVPEPLDEAIRKALSKTPSERFSTVREFADALQRALGEQFDRGTAGSLGKNLTSEASGLLAIGRARLRLRTLGNPAVEGGKPGPSVTVAQRKSLALLALLAAAGERGASRDKVLAYLWPETETDKAAHRLSQVLHALRRDLRAEALFLGTGTLRLNPEVISSDVGEFTNALDQGDLERAVSLYGGPFLDGFFLSGAPEFERWVESERAQHRRRCEAALESLASTAAKGNDWEGSVRWWRRLADGDPLNSRVAVRFLEALSAAGDRVGALEFARVHEKLVREEFEAAPDPAVMAAIERIRSHPAAPGPTATVAPSAGPPAPVTAIAVLPFVNLSANQEDEYFSDGMAEELINALAQVNDLRVASRTASFVFKGKSTDIREVGDRLKVGAVVEGSVRKTGSRVRITAQLVTVADGYYVWAQSYDRTLADVFVVQAELAQAIVGALSLKLVPKPGVLTGKPATSVLEAYTLYLRGRYFTNKWTVEGWRTATEYFEEVVKRDPRHAPAYEGLAECYASRTFDDFSADLRPSEGMPKAKTAALRALELDPTLAGAHGWLGVIAWLYEWDAAAADREFQRALSVNPRALDPLDWYAVSLSARGRHAEALALLARAEALDPGSLVVQSVVGRCCYWAGRYDEAIERLRATLDGDPDHLQAYLWIARTLAAKGLMNEGAETVNRGISRLGRLPILLALLGFLCGRMGKRAAALEILAELRQEGQRRYVPVIYEAMILAGLGDVNGAFDSLNAAYEQRSGILTFLQAGRWGKLGADPRFAALVKRVGLGS